MTYLQLLLEEARDGIPEEKKKKGKLLGKKMERRSERSNKNNQRQAGKEQSQSWIWERSGELANEGDIGMQ